MEALEKLEKINNTHTQSIIEFIRLHLNKFLLISYELLSIPFVTRDGKYRQARFPYQVIGGMGIHIMNSLYPTGKHIHTADIDIEIAPLVSLSGNKAIPLGVYESTNASGNVEFPLLKSKKGKAVDKVYKVHDAYLDYIKFLSYNLGLILTRELPSLSELNSVLKPVDPRMDPETINEIPEFSYDVGNFHVSVIFNINFISKIQIVINLNDKIEHVVEFIFFKSVYSYFYPGIENIYPFVLKNTLIAPPYDLLKQNIEALLSRMYKKEMFDSTYLKKQNAESRSDLIRMNYKMKETIYRFSVLLEINALYLTSIDTTSSSTVRSNITQALYYFIIELNKKTYRTQMVIALLYEVFSSNIEILKFILGERFDHFKTLIDSFSTKLVAAAPPANEPFTAVTRGAKVENAVVSAIARTPGYFNVLSNNNTNILKPSVSSVHDTNTKTNRPLPKIVLEENIDKLIAEAIKNNKAPPSNNDYSVINCVVIKEPACIEIPKENIIGITDPNGKLTTILRRHRTNLKTILNFINTKTPDFLFIYIMPSRIYSYYKIEESLASNIIYEPPCFYHIYVLLEILYIFINKSLTNVDISNYYDFYLMTLEQLKNNEMLSESYIQEKLNECDHAFVKTQFDKKNTQKVVDKLKSIISTIIITLLWTLIEKYNLKNLYPKIDGLQALFQKYKNKEISNTQLFGFLLLIRGSILNRIITTNYKKSVYLFIPHRFIGTFGLNDTQVNVDLYQLLEAFHRLQFRYDDFPKPSFNKLLDGVISNPADYKDNTNEICLDYNANMILNIIDLDNYDIKQKDLVNYVFKSFSDILLNDVEFLLKIDAIIKIPDLRTRMTKLRSTIEDTQLNANQSFHSDNNTGNKNILITSNPEFAALLMDGLKKKTKTKVNAYLEAHPDFKTELDLAERTDSFMIKLDIITSDPRNIDKIKALYPHYTRFIYTPKAGGSRKTRKAK